MTPYDSRVGNKSCSVVVGTASVAGSGKAGVFLDLAAAASQHPGAVSYESICLSRSDDVFRCFPRENLITERHKSNRKEERRLKI